MGPQKCRKDVTSGANDHGVYKANAEKTNPLRKRITLARQTAVPLLVGVVLVSCTTAGLARIMVRPDLRGAVVGSFVGALIGDALSMPVHWYYNVRDIAADFGVVLDFQAVS